MVDWHRLVEKATTLMYCAEPIVRTRVLELLPHILRSLELSSRQPFASKVAASLQGTCEKEQYAALRALRFLDPDESVLPVVASLLRSNVLKLRCEALGMLTFLGRRAPDRPCPHFIASRAFASEIAAMLGSDDENERSAALKVLELSLLARFGRCAGFLTDLMREIAARVGRAFGGNRASERHEALEVLEQLGEAGAAPKINAFLGGTDKASMYDRRCAIGFMEASRHREHQMKHSVAHNKWRKGF